MIRVTIELLPQGHDDRVRRIGTIEIANVGGDATIGVYDYTIQQRTQDGRLTAGSGRIKDFPRKLGADHLLRWVLSDALAEQP